jgi:hypothetical protein
MAEDGAHTMFLQLEGIPGGSTAKGRKGWIDIIGVDWGVHQSVAFDGTGSMSGFDPKQRPLKFTGRSGPASPLLFETCVTGKLITKGTFEVQHGKAVVARWVFEGALLTAFDSKTIDAEDGLFDTLTLLAHALRYTTKATRGWNFLSHKPW